MPIQSFSVSLILRHNPIQRIRHVGPDIIVPVLIQAQRAARMLDEQVQDADAEGAQHVVLRITIIIGCVLSNAPFSASASASASECTLNLIRDEIAAG